MDINLAGVSSVLLSSSRSRSQLDFLLTQLLLLADFRQYLFDMPEEKQFRLLTALQVVTVQEGEFVFHKGDPSEWLFTLLSGSVAIHDGFGAESPQVATLDPGRIFGERGLVRKTARLFSARAVADCSLMKLSAPEFRAVLEPAFRTRSEEKLAFVDKHLPGAKNIFSTVKDKLSFAMTMRFCHKGHRLLAQGRFSDFLFFIISGECAVSQARLGGPSPVVTLTPGGLFGDESILLSRPSSYNVDVSAEGTRLYALSRADTFQFIPEPVLDGMRRQCLLKFDTRNDLLQKNNLSPRFSLQPSPAPATFRFASPYAQRKLAHAQQSRLSLNPTDASTLESLRLDLCHFTPSLKDTDEADCKRSKTKGRCKMG